MNSNMAAGSNAAGATVEIGAGGNLINFDLRVVAEAVASGTVRGFDFALDDRGPFAGRFFVRVVIRPPVMLGPHDPNAVVVLSFVAMVNPNKQFQLSGNPNLGC
jgi:hypothetical protein